MPRFPRRLRLYCFLQSFLLLLGTAVAQPVQLKVSENQRHLIRQNEVPFFWLADTAWELFHRLDRKETDHYLSRRVSQGFTVIQAAVLAELDGLRVPSALGDLPLIDNDPTRPNNAYFAHVDYVVSKAEELGLVMAMLPTWGDKWNRKWGIGPEVFTPDNAKAFGAFLAKRYRNKPIVWVLGGDRNPDSSEHFNVIRAMAEGLQAGGDTKQLVTYHPQGGFSSSAFFANEPWLDFNMFQSGHSAADTLNFDMTLNHYQMSPIKPVLDGEPNYEDHPIAWNDENGWFDEFDSRRAGYWSLLSGAMGHTYGNHSVWQMWQPGRKPISAARTPWRDALEYPGANQAGHMRRFFESRNWWLLQPAQELLVNASQMARQDVLVAIAADDSFVFAYSHYGKSFTLSLTQFDPEKLTASWCNPRDGTRSSAFRLMGKQVLFDPPGDSNRGNDWLLIIDI